MPAYHKLNNQHYFWIGTWLVSIFTFLFLVWFFIHLSNGWEMELAMERDVALRRIGCVPEELHAYDSVMFGQAPATIWRCDGKLVDDQFANVLVQANKDGDLAYWKKLQAIKK